MAQEDIAELVDTVRKIAKPSLARFAKREHEECTESYLFSSDQFCGLRIRLGAFEAIWRLGEVKIEISRDGHLLQMLTIGESDRKAAA